MTERRSPNEIPDELKTLVRCILTGFSTTYTVECQIIMETMRHYRRITEDDLLQLLHFDKKQFRAAINVLKDDKFIYEAQLLEPGDNNKHVKKSYFYVDYTILVAVVKYKCLNVKNKIESMEKKEICRCSYHCPQCRRMFSDLDLMSLLDTVTEQLRCNYCSTEVVETTVNADSGMKLKTFNQQLAPIQLLLDQLDKIEFSSCLQSQNIEHCLDESRPTNKLIWSGESNRTGKGASVVIVENNLQQQPQVCREVPAWIRLSAVDNSNPTMTQEQKPVIPEPVAHVRNERPLAHEIELLLFKHEKKTDPSRLKVSNSGFGDPEDDNYYYGVRFTVKVGGEKLVFDDITPDIASEMTAEEREEYCRVGREIRSMYYW